MLYVEYSSLTENSPLTVCSCGFALTDPSFGYVAGVTRNVSTVAMIVATGAGVGASCDFSDDVGADLMSSPSVV